MDVVKKIEDETVKAVLKNILASPEFASSPRVSDALRYIVEETLAGRASGIKAFFSITLPLIRYPLFISTILGTILAINSFDLFFVLTKGGPSNITTNATLFDWNNAFKFYHLSYASAISYVILMFSMLVTIGYVVLTRRNQVE